MSTRVVPFLEDLSNWMDIRLAHQILADKPFEAPHGKAGEEWMKSAHFLSKAVDPDAGWKICVSKWHQASSAQGSIQ